MESKKKRGRRAGELSTIGLVLLFSSVIMLIVIVVVVLSISVLLPLPFSYAQQQLKNAAPTDSAPSCITYDSTDNIITINCGSARLTDIDNQIRDTNVIHKEEEKNTTTTAAGDEHREGGVWLLKAGIVVAKGAVLYINSTDTKWLKIIPDETSGNGIEVYGSLKIDSVKITSWNPGTNDYVKFKVKKIPPDVGEEAPYDKIPRPFIRVEHGATGTTDITNSEIASDCIISSDY